MYEEPLALPCEVLRGALHLLACSQRSLLRAAAVQFFGAGEGHGLGLDVEWAKARRLSAERILQRAYGGEVVGG